MRVIVIGGGIGGAAAGIALAKAGLDPLVLEQAPALTEVGAGLGLAANALKALEHLEVAAPIRRRAVPVRQSVWYGLERREEVFRQQYDPMVDRYGDRYHCAHRADLLDALAAALPEQRIRLNARVVDVEQTPDGVTVRLQSGEEIEGDLAVGADGLRSRVRARLFGEQPARFTGVVVWRGLIPSDLVPTRFGDQITVWAGPARHAMLYPVRERLFNFSGFVPAEEVHRESWTPDGDVEDLRRSFAGACGEVLDLIDAVPQALITPIYFRDALERWGTDRVVLLGDAAHPAPPSAGQGASMALEDAVTLAACLRRGGAAAIPAALDEYARRRRPRTTRMLMASRINLALLTERDPVQARARNTRMRGLQRVDPLGETTLGWLYDHDPVAAAEQPPTEAAATHNPLRRDGARRAFALWRDALGFEDRAGLWRGERAGYERFLLQTCPPPSALAVEELSCDGIPALSVTPPGSPADGPVVLHLHGGGFVLGSARASVQLAGRLAEAIGGWGLTVDYRLGPEHPYPAALEDALAAYRWLVARTPAARVLLSGECAGGGLAVSLAVALRAAGDPPPGAIHVVSPFCDLTVSAPSITENAASDPWLSRSLLCTLAGSYLDTADPTSPLVSPVYADLSGLPPLSIHAASGEVLRDDATRLAASARAAGVDVSLELVDDTVHSFVLFDFLPESEAALARAAALLRPVRHGPTASRP